MGHTHRYKFGFEKKNQVKSPSICSRTPKPVRIRQSGRTGNRGVTGMMPLMPPMHPSFGVGSTFYAQPTTLIRGFNDLLSLPLGQHILNYEPPRGFVIPTFTMFDGSNNPYDHMLHYNQGLKMLPCLSAQGRTLPTSQLSMSVLERPS